MKFAAFALVASGNAHCTLDKTFTWHDASVVATSVGPFTSPDECDKKCGGLANWNVNTQNDCFCLEDPMGHITLVKANPNIRPEMGKTAACGGKALLSASADSTGHESKQVAEACDCSCKPAEGKWKPFVDKGFESICCRTVLPKGSHGECTVCCGKSDIVMLIGDMSPSKNIVELAESVPTLSTLVAAVVAGDLAETFSQPGPFTVFAPTNDAFNALPEGVLNSLMKPANKDLLSNILKFHVLPGQVFTDDLSTDSDVFKTVDGKLVVVVKSKEEGVGVVPYGGGNRYTQGYPKVTAADNKASNGVVHIIDGVLLPPAGEYAQCGGKEFKGLLTSCWPLECVKQNDYYSQCLKPTLSSAVDTMV